MRIIRVIKTPDSDWGWLASLLKVFLLNAEWYGTPAMVHLRNGKPPSNLNISSIRTSRLFTDRYKAKKKKKKRLCLALYFSLSQRGDSVCGTSLAVSWHKQGRRKEHGKRQMALKMAARLVFTPASRTGIYSQNEARNVRVGSRLRSKRFIHYSPPQTTSSIAPKQYQNAYWYTV